MDGVRQLTLTKVREQHRAALQAIAALLFEGGPAAAEILAAVHRSTAAGPARRGPDPARLRPYRTGRPPTAAQLDLAERRIAEGWTVSDEVRTDRGMLQRWLSETSGGDAG